MFGTLRLKSQGRILSFLWVWLIRRRLSPPLNDLSIPPTTIDSPGNATPFYRGSGYISPIYRTRRESAGELLDIKRLQLSEVEKGGRDNYKLAIIRQGIFFVILKMFKRKRLEFFCFLARYNIPFPFESTKYAARMSRFGEFNRRRDSHIITSENQYHVKLRFFSIRSDKVMYYDESRVNRNVDLYI